MPTSVWKAAMLTNHCTTTNSPTSVEFLVFLQGLIPCRLPWEASPDIPRQMWSLRLLVIHGIWLVPLNWLSCIRTCTLFDSARLLFSFILVAPQGQGLLRHRKGRLCWNSQYPDCEIVLESCKSYHWEKLGKGCTRSLCIVSYNSIRIYNYVQIKILIKNKAHRIVRPERWKKLKRSSSPVFT